MFVVYMILISIVVYVVRSSRNISGEKRSKRNAIENGYKTYTTRNGYQARVSDDVVVAYKHDLFTGDTIEYNPMTGRTYRNVTRDLRKRYDEDGRKKAIAKGETLYCYDPRDNWRCHPDGYAGKHWKDMETGKCYVKRYVDLGAAIALVNIQDAKFERIINIEELNETQLRNAKKYMEMHNGFSKAIRESIKKYANVYEGDDN